MTDKTLHNMRDERFDSILPYFEKNSDEKGKMLPMGGIKKEGTSAKFATPRSLRRVCLITNTTHFGPVRSHISMCTWGLVLGEFT